MDIEPFLHMILLNEAHNSCAFDGIMADLESILIFSKQTADGIIVKNYCNTLQRLKKEPYIEKNPYISVNDISREFGMAYNTAAKYIEILCEMGVLLKTEGQMRYRLFRFDGLLRLFQYVNN